MLFKKIDPSSANSIPSSLALFDTPESNVGIQSSTIREFLTLNTVDNDPHTFKLPPSSMHLDPNHVYLEAKLQIVKGKDGEYVKIDATDDKVGVIQAIGATWIRDMNITMQGREIFNANSLYSQKAFTDIELTHNRATKASYLHAVGYYPSNPDDDNVDSAADAGFKARQKLFANGAIVTFYVKLNADIFNCGKLLPNHVAIEIELRQQPSSFCLLDYSTRTATSPEYKLAVKGLRLYAKYVELMDGIAMDMEHRLERVPARYGMRKSEMRSHIIMSGKGEYQTTLYTERLPRRVIITLLDQAAHKGTLNMSPFYYGHYGVQEISITSGGLVWPAVPYRLSWGPGGSFMRAYHDMMDGMGMANTLETNGISPHNYENGSCFFVFTLTNSLEDTQGFDLIKAGSTSITIRFKEAIKQSLALIAYAEFDSLTSIDKNRHVITDLTA